MAGGPSNNVRLWFLQEIEWMLEYAQVDRSPSLYVLIASVLRLMIRSDLSSLLYDHIAAYYTNDFLYTYKICNCPHSFIVETIEGTMVYLTSRRCLVSHLITSLTNLRGLLYNQTHAFR